MGSSPFARRYLGNRCFFLFLRVLRCFSSPGSPRTPMDSVHGDRSSSCRVPPFRDLRIKGYLLLPAAYRSLSRLSSALSAKASALRPNLLDLCNVPYKRHLTVQLPSRSVVMDFWFSKIDSIFHSSFPVLFSQARSLYSA